MADMVLTRQDVLNRLLAELPGILAGQPVMLTYLYGSVAEDCALQQSDVDIALVLAPDHPISAYQRTRMELDIASEIETRCELRQADVRSVNDAPIMVQGTVVTEGVLVYSRDEDFRTDYEVLTRKRYFDFAPVARMMQRAYFEHMGAELRRQGLLADGQVEQN
jgi:predicted nucleotidyltransferase